MRVNHRYDLFFDESPDAVTHQNLFIAEQVIHPIEIHSLERHKASAEKVS
jgi:ureidoglycolate hydrolase